MYQSGSSIKKIAVHLQSQGVKVTADLLYRRFKEEGLTRPNGGTYSFFLKNEGYPKNCEFCKQEYKATNPLQKWCDVCIPDELAAHRFRTYGVTGPQLEDIIRKQNGTCALCEREPKVVDHCHTTGRVRGVLCTRCNHAMAGIDIPGWAERAVQYSKFGVHT